jgi:hypothetical protein
LHPFRTHFFELLENEFFFGVCPRKILVSINEIIVVAMAALTGGAVTHPFADRIPISFPVIVDETEQFVIFLAGEFVAAGTGNRDGTEHSI